MRGYARETAFCKVFSFLLSGNVDDDFSQFDESKLTDEDKAFAMKLVQGVVDNKQTLDAVVSEYSKAFKINRIYRPDLAALEIAVYEMQFTDTPHPIIINEAVGIVKKYSTEKSTQFVNGILASYERSFANG